MTTTTTTTESRLLTIIIFRSEKSEPSPVEVSDKSRESLALDGVTGAESYEVREVYRGEGERGVCGYRGQLGDMEPCTVWLRVLDRCWRHRAHDSHHAFSHQVLNCGVITRLANQVLSSESVLVAFYCSKYICRFNIISLRSAFCKIHKTSFKPVTKEMINIFTLKTNSLHFITIPTEIFLLQTKNKNREIGLFTQWSWLLVSKLGSSVSLVGQNTPMRREQRTLDVRWLREKQLFYY